MHRREGSLVMCWYAEERNTEEWELWRGEICRRKGTQKSGSCVNGRGEICRRKGRVTTVILLCEPRFSPDGSLIVVGSDDACVDIYTTQGLSRVGYCRGIPSFVTHLDWSQDGKYLQVCI